MDRLAAYADHVGLFVFRFFFEKATDSNPAIDSTIRSLSVVTAKGKCHIPFSLAMCLY
ncbi:MAG: hypothetical protein ACLTZY_14955 [Alistipes indistinctus]